MYGCGAIFRLQRDFSRVVAWERQLHALDDRSLAEYHHAAVEVGHSPSIDNIRC